MRRELICIFTGVLLLGGCWNDNTNVRMGDVSIGQQMIDLKQALDQQAISEAEYQRLKTQIMSLAEACKRAQEAGEG